ncbi:MAG: ABC transporter substrate-binding protein [Eubacteriales bacterium]|nr:ABC transporter substrate-binding protein [Eubacteriales bacterium]
MKFKKLTAVVAIVAAATMLFTACGSSDSAKKDSGDKSYNIGVVQLLEHPALDKATEGFQDAVKDELGDKAKVTVKNAQNEPANCTTIVSKFVNDKADLIMANATPALQAAAQGTDSIPILGTSVTDYATALDIKDWTGKTGKNISGTSDLAPLKDQADMIKEFVPNAKQVGLLYCSAEANSTYQIKEIEKYLKKLGMKYKEYTVSDSNDIQAVVTKACNECDVLYAPTDNTLAGSTKTIENVVVAKKIPLIAGEENICKGCGVATLSISYYDLGYETGKMAAEILKDGKDPADMEIRTAPKVTKEYNKELCKKIGVKVPDGYKAIEE